MSKQCKCPMCNSNALKDTDMSVPSTFYTCPVCGRIELQLPLDINIDKSDRSHVVL